jgi:diguanylate cyclase (GGDEF)-like protein
MQHVSCVLIEDSPSDADVVQRLLQSDKNAFSFTHVASLAAFAVVLEGNAPPDVALLDLSLPGANGVDAVIQCRELNPNVPIVALADHDDINLATRALAAGAQECLVKDELDERTLSRVVHHAIIRCRLEQQRVISEARMAAALEGGRLGVWDWLLSDDTFTGSARHLGHLGFSPDDIYLPRTAEQWLMRTHPEDIGRLQQAVKQHLDGASPRYQCEFRAKHRDGHWVWLFESGHVISRDANGRPLRMVGMQQDISERKSMEECLARLAFHDELTGLPNRRSFMSTMDREYGRIKRQKDYQTCVLMLDIDHFKRVNDGYGHAAGDLVLAELGKTMAGQLRETDVSGRLGGEEFAVVLADTCLDDAIGVGEKVRKAIEDMRVNWQGTHALSVTTSVGVAQLLATDARPDGALTRADVALYTAKQNGRNRVCHLEASHAAEVEPGASHQASASL